MNALWNEDTELFAMFFFMFVVLEKKAIALAEQSTIKENGAVRPDILNVFCVSISTHQKKPFSCSSEHAKETCVDLDQIQSFLPSTICCASRARRDAGMRFLIRLRPDPPESVLKSATCRASRARRCAFVVPHRQGATQGCVS